MKTLHRLFDWLIPSRRQVCALRYENGILREQLAVALSLYQRTIAIGNTVMTMEEAARIRAIEVQLYKMNIPPTAFSP